MLKFSKFEYRGRPSQNRAGLASFKFLAKIGSKASCITKLPSSNFYHKIGPRLYIGVLYKKSFFWWPNWEIPEWPILYIWNLSTKKQTNGRVWIHSSPVCKTGDRVAIKPCIMPYIIARDYLGGIIYMKVNLFSATRRKSLWEITLLLNI